MIRRFEAPRPTCRFGRLELRPQLHVLRNQRVGKMCKVAALDPQFIAVARARTSAVEFLAYSISMSKKPLSNAAVSQSSNSPSIFERVELCAINSSYGKASCG